MIAIINTLGNQFRGGYKNPTAGCPAVPSSSGWFLLFQTMTTAQNLTEPPVNRRLGFEVTPYAMLVQL